MNDLIKNIILWVVVAVILMSVFSNLTQNAKTQEISYSEFIKSINSNQVTDVMLTGRVITGTLQGGTKFSTYSPETDNKAMIGDLLKGGVVIKAKPLEQSVWMQIFISSFPFLIIIGIWLYFMRQMQGGGKGGAMSFGKSKAKLMMENKPKIIRLKFRDFNHIVLIFHAADF